MVVSFSKFAALSGLGWGVDFSIYLLLVNFLDFPPFFSNFISAMIATTIVYFISLKKIFNRSSKAGMNFLLIYWIYQLLSIAIYSALLHPVISWFATIDTLGMDYALVAKVAVTPFNLITNYIFMNVLIRFMNNSQR